MMTSGKIIVLITGANSGVGYETTKKLVSDPKYCVIMACRSVDKGQKALLDIQASNSTKGQVSLVHLDVTSDELISAAVAKIESDFGRLDVLINNAAINSFAESTAERWHYSLAANVIGPAAITDAFQSLLMRSNNPYLIYVSSGLGSLTWFTDKNNPFYSVDEVEYRGSKSALNMLALWHSKVLGSNGVKVFACCPGFVVTNLSGSSEEELQKRRDNGALSPETSAIFLSSVIEGDRDADVGKFIHKDGIYPW